MSDYLPDTPLMGRWYCPGCEPEADPIAEILDVRYCDGHAPNREGAEDGQVTEQGYMSGSAEAGGDENRAACDMIHRPRKEGA